ncbi:MAG: hypothetical protein SGPRY_008060 [Prymnesium sp.]
MNEMVPVLRTNTSLRLCIECAKTETPGILSQLEASQVDELLWQKKVKRSFRSLAEKKKHLLSLCRFAKNPKEGVGNATAKEAQPKTRHAVLLRAAAMEKDQRIQMTRRLTIRPRNLKLGLALSP